MGKTKFRNSFSFPELIVKKRLAEFSGMCKGLEFSEIDWLALTIPTTSSHPTRLLLSTKPYYTIGGSQQAFAYFFR